MPSRAVARRSRRRPRRRFRRSRPRSAFSYGPIRSIFIDQRVIPDATFVKLAYYTTSNQDPTTISTRLLFSGNGAFDPEPLVSAQPVGFDQWAQLYTHYEVIRSSIDARLINQTDASPITWAVYPAFNSFPDTTYQDAAAQPYGKNALCGQVSSGSFSSRIRSSMSTSKLLGRPTWSNNYTAATTSNPPTQWQWIMEFQSIIAAPLLFNIQANITYYVRFYQRRTIEDA